MFILSELEAVVFASDHKTIVVTGFKAVIVAEVKASVVAEVKASVVAEVKASVVTEVKASVVAEVKASVVAEVKASVGIVLLILRRGIGLAASLLAGGNSSRLRRIGAKIIKNDLTDTANVIQIRMTERELELK